ncbi:MAG: TRZ/ATZ family hydrolase [Burkholderiales bacterium]|nr:TRZ/ATZ family hydrolase [Burkholderiales bacterium]
MRTIDTLINARWILPIEPPGIVLEHHSIAIDAGRIVALLPTADATVDFAAREHIELNQHVLMPGLINLHTHAAMTLMRGLADDLPLMTWLKDHIWPAEGHHLAPSFVKDGTQLACAEMLRGGVTCFNDMYFFPEATAQAVDQAGMRAMIGMIAIEFPTPYAADADDYLRKGLEVRDAYRDHARIAFSMAPHAPYTVSDKTFEKILTLAEQLEAPIHIHMHETQDEIDQSLNDHQLRPLARLQKLGLLSPSVIATHMVHLTQDEIALCAERGVNIAHCPVSNLKLASGIAPIAQLIARGVNIGLGTDGAASNNRLDLLSEMRIAALLAKGASGDATALPAHQALAMATLNSAKALGLEQEIGSLKPGKAADIVAIELATLETAPLYDVASHLVYVAGREQVTDVWVSGKRLLSSRTLTTLDAHELAAKAAHWQGVLKS